MLISAPPRPIPSPEAHHLKPLDGLRGIAILLVMLTHCFESNTNGRGWLLHLVGTVFDCGRFGVDLFFVLSGFLITGILIDTRHDPRFFRSFFGRRALRIFPLYYGVLGTLLLLSVPFHWHWNGMAPYLLTYVQNFRPYGIDTLAVGPGISLFHFWSLAIEEQFYLLWPPLVYLLRGRRGGVFWAALLGIAAVLLLRCVLTVLGLPYLLLHMSLPTRADSLLVGALLAVGYRDSRAWARLLQLSPAVFLFLGTVLFGTILAKGIMAGPPLWFLGVRYTVLAVCFASLLCWSLKPASLANTVCEWPWLRNLGKYSYGLYVLHVLVISQVRLPLRYALQVATGSRGLAVAVTGLVCMLLAYLAAYLSFHLFEQRFLRLKRLFAYTVIEPARTGFAQLAVSNGSASRSSKQGAR